MTRLVDRWSAVMMNNYGTPPLALAGGHGAVVTDVDGKSYIDLLSSHHRQSIAAWLYGNTSQALANQFRYKKI